MSNVLERFRGSSKFQLLTDTEKFDGMLMNWFLNEKNVPKRKRSLFQQDLKSACRNLLMYVEKAHYTFPSGQEAIKQRLEYIQQAQNSCSDVWYELKFLDNTLQFGCGIDLNKLSPILSLLLKIGNSLKRWKEETKQKLSVKKE